MECFFESMPHIPESIFGYLSFQDLKNCCEASPKTKLFLTREGGIFENGLTTEADWNFIEQKQVYKYLCTAGALKGLALKRYYGLREWRGKVPLRYRRDRRLNEVPQLDVREVLPEVVVIRGHA